MKIPPDPFGVLMAKKVSKDKDTTKIEEPSILIRPINRLGGLDNIHVALLALIVVLVLLLLTITYYKPVSATNSTNSVLTTTVSNSSGSLSTIHNSTVIKRIAEQLLASYVSTNSSLSVLPFYSNVSGITASYVPSIKDWYVQIPATNPGSKTVIYVSTLISDSNGSVLIPFLQLPKPRRIMSNYVVSSGVIQLAGQPVCLTQAPLQLYWFMDPYSPGAVQSLKNLTALQQRYGTKANASLEILYGSASASIANQTSVPAAQALGKYLFCASKQPGQFPQFVSLLNNVYSNGYITANELQSISGTSGLNQTSLAGCMSGTNPAFAAQTILASRYNITVSPSIVVNCDTLAIPQTVNKAMCYANSTFC